MHAIIDENLEGLPFLDINHKSGVGLTALQSAAHALIAENMRVLLKYGADSYVFDQKDSDICDYINSVFTGNEVGFDEIINQVENLLC